MTTETASNIRKTGMRCGWCLNNDHANCATSIAMGTPARPTDGGTRGVWRCPCECNTADRTRCVDCRRRDREVNAFSQCADADECRLYRQTRRVTDPAFQVIDEITAEQVAHQRAPRAKAEPKSKTGECLCCGAATRGGKFLPGHDARFVSEQAAAYINEEDPEVARTLYTKMDELGPKLHAKFVKRVVALHAAAEAEK